MRVYIDTSVFGGYFDEEFQEASRKFFSTIFKTNDVVLISDTLIGELVKAPEKVQDLLDRVMQTNSERIGLSEEVYHLRDAYLEEGVLSKKWSDDALHVAHATLADADVIISWNFKHLLNPLRIHQFNEINIERGYEPVVIMTPSDLNQVWENNYENKT